MSTTPDHILDALLVMQAQAGEAAAMTRLVSRWQGRLIGHARVLLGHGDDAHDAVQETWLAIVRGLSRLNDPDAFAPYVYRILRNKCVERIRKVRTDRARTTALDADPADPISKEREGAESDSARIRAALMMLNADEREILSLKYACDLGIHQIADTLSIPTGTVKTRLFRARNELKTILERKPHEQPR